MTVLWKTSPFTASCRTSSRTITFVLLVTVLIGVLVATGVSCSGDDIPPETKINWKKAE